MGEIEIDPRGSEAHHDEKDRQENEKPFNMSSLFSRPHIYNVREKTISVNRKYGSSFVTFPRIPLSLGQVEAERWEERGLRSLGSLRALIWFVWFIGFVELLEFVELTVVLETNALEKWGTHRG
jgi:hypothetical protein